MRFTTITNGVGRMTCVSGEHEIPLQKSIHLYSFLQYEREMMTCGVMQGVPMISGPVGYQIEVGRHEMAGFLNSMRKRLKDGTGGLAMIKKIERT